MIYSNHQSYFNTDLFTDKNYNSSKGYNQTLFQTLQDPFKKFEFEDVNQREKFKEDSKQKTKLVYNLFVN